MCVMKNIQTILLSLILTLPVGLSFSQSENAMTPNALKPAKTKAFHVGEQLNYRIHYGIINAGVAELKVTEENMRGSTPVVHMVGTGKTVGMAEWFFKTRDRYETYMDTEKMVPVEFIRDVNEGGYKINRHLYFDHNSYTVKDTKAPQKGTMDIMDNTQDIFSCFYYARTLDASQLKEGDMLQFNMFLDHELYPFGLRLVGREWVKTDHGKIKCLKFQPILQEGRVFKDKEGMIIYISDDENKIPVLIESELLVGSIKVELTDYKGLKNPISFKK